MYIKDKPCGLDLFDSSAHQKTADAIEQVIKNKGMKIDIIGLEGDWGSGKSNVVEIIRNSLESTHHFFIYDAWGHQEDLQRRSFLEELTQDLCDCEILKNISKWEEKLEDLLSKKTKNITKTVPKLNQQFFVIFIVVLLNSIISKLDFFVLFDLDNTWIFTLLFLILNNLPILSWLIFKLLSNTKVFTKHKELKYSQRLKMEISELLQIYKNESLESTIETITSTREPSVREFKNWMNDLSKELEKELVVVFDNMDRLENEKAKNLWSSIHTFFSENDYEGIHTIVPFDRNQIRKIFSINYNDDKENNADRFIDKTFELVFRVTPPVLSDWKCYFEHMFQSMDFSCDNDEFTVTRNLYDKIHLNIKPRDIILFLNELYLYHSIWKEEIPVRYIALFILNKNDIIIDPVNTIVAGKYNIGVSYYFDQNLQKYLSAIVYNVSPDVAEQVLLSREIKNAINNNNMERFEFLSKAYAFDTVCENIFDEIENIESGVTAIYNVLFENEDKAKLFRISNNIILQKYYENSVTAVDFKEYIKILVLMNLDQKKNIFEHYFGSITSVSKLSGSDYFDVIQDIENFIEVNKLDYDLKKHIPVKSLELNEAINFVNKLKLPAKTYKVTTDIKILDKKLNEMISTDNFDQPIIDSLEFLRPECKKLDVTRKTITNKVDNDQISFNSVEFVYKIIFSLSDIPISKEFILKESIICQLIHNNYTIRSNNLYILIAMLLRKMNENNERLIIVDSYPYLVQILSSTEEILITGVMDYLNNFMNIGNLFTALLKNNNNLIKKVTLDKMKTDDIRMNVMDTIKNYDEIKNLLEITDDSLISFISRWASTIDDGFKTHPVFDVIKSIKFIDEILECKFYLKESVLQASFNFFNLQKNVYFEKLFTSSESNVELIVFHHLCKNDKIHTFTADMNIAYKDALIKNLSQRKTNNFLVDIFDLIYNQIDKNTLRGSLTSIRDKLVSEINIQDIDMTFYVPLIMKHSRLYEKPFDSINKIIIPVLKSQPNLIINHDYEKTLQLVSKNTNSGASTLAEMLQSLDQNDLAKLIYDKIDEQDN